MHANEAVGTFALNISPDEHFSNHQAQRRMNAVRWVVSFSALCVLLLSGCKTQTVVLQSAFNLGNVGQGVLGTSVGQIQGGLLSPPPPGVKSTDKWAQVTAGYNNGMSCQLNPYVTLTPPPPNAISVSANLYIPSTSRNGCDAIIQFPNNYNAQTPLFEVDFLTANNTMKIIDDSTGKSFVAPGTFPRDQEFSILITLTINIDLNPTTGQPVLGANGQPEYQYGANAAVESPLMGAPLALNPTEFQNGPGFPTQLDYVEFQGPTSGGSSGLYYVNDIVVTAFSN
jgi:hypothetical protein